MASIIFNIFSSSAGCFSCSGITMHTTVSSYEICFVGGLFDFKERTICIRAQQRAMTYLKSSSSAFTETWPLTGLCASPSPVISNRQKWVCIIVFDLILGRSLRRLRDSFCVYCVHLVNFVLIDIRPTTFINIHHVRVEFRYFLLASVKKDKVRYKNEINWDYTRRACYLCFLLFESVERGSQWG